jgi:hypothetical protein
MVRLFARWLVSLLLIAPGAFTEEGEWSGAYTAKLQGKLVKKYFSAPKIIAHPPFGWFIELDDSSKQIVGDLFNNLSELEKELYHDIDLACVRLLTNQFSMRDWARDHFETQVIVEGDISSPDLLGSELRAFNFTPETVSPEITETKFVASLLDEHPWEPNSFDWDEENDESLALPDNEPESLVTMTGKLHLEVLNSDSELGEIENGGYPLYCWMITLDPKSFEVACSTPVRACFQTPASILSQKNSHELYLTGSYDKEWLSEQVGQNISIQGYLWHAHTAHHPTPLMLDTDPWFK